MKQLSGAQGAFIVRILMEAMQSAKAAGKRILEAGYTGQKKDKNGHTRYYQDGRQVKNPNAKEKAQINAAAGTPLPAGQAPSHTDAATRVDALQADTPPQQVKALANDLMQMDTKDLEKMTQDEPQKRTSYAGENGDVIQTPGGYIDIQFQKNSTSPRKQSVIGFVVDEDKRGQGIGDKLLKQAKQKYPDLGGQVSSKASLKVFYNNGFRSPDMPEASFAETLQHWQNEGGSLFMAANDENGKPYATGNEPKQSTASTSSTSELSPEQIENYKNLIASIEKQLDPTKTDLSRYSQEKINGVISKLNEYRAKIGLPPYQTNNKAEETPPAPAAPTPPAAGMNPEALALDALRLKQNRKPHNASHITPDAVAGLKAKGLIDDANKITDKGREQLYAAKNKTVRKATGPKATAPAAAPAAPTNLGADADALEALRLKSNRKQHIAGHITPEAIASLKKQGFIDDNNKLTMMGRAHLALQKGSKMPAQPGASKAKRASRNKDSLISIVRRKGGINSDSVKSDYDYKNDIIEGGLLHAIRRQGMGLDEMAQTLMVEGHIIVPEGVDPGEHLLNEMKARHNSALKDTTKEIDLEQEAYYKAKQKAEQEGHDERDIESIRRSNVQTGESAGQEEGYRALDEWDNSGAGTQGGGETGATVSGDGYDSTAGDDYDRNATTGPVDTSFDFGFNAKPKDETPAEPTPEPAPTASEPEPVQAQAPTPTPAAPTATSPAEQTSDELLKRHLQRQGFTGFDAQGREWRNGELVAAQPEEPKQKRAAAGGEIGPNGEHYRGGAFIATTELPKRLKDKIKQAAGDGMVKVTDPKTGNTTRETPPSPNLMSISASMIGTFISPRGDVNHNYLDALEDRGASYDLRTKINELARKYKAGEKWVPINDFPEVAKGNDIYRLADAGLPIHPELLKRMPEEFKDYYNYQKSNEELKNDSAREDFDKIQIGDKFKDKTGKEYVIHKKGAGTVRAWPLINGEPRPSSEKKFAITAAAKQHYPDHEKSVSLEDFTQAAPAPAEQNKEIETDPARQQQIKNSIAHGELILKYGKKVSGQKYSTDELNAVVKSVNSERAKLGEPGFTGTDAEGRQWQNGELVAAKDDEPTEAPVGNTDLFGNPTKPAPKGPETMPGLFGDAVPIAPDAPAAAGGEPLPGSDNPLDRAGAGRGKQDATQDMFGLFGPGARAKKKAKDDPTKNDAFVSAPEPDAINASYTQEFTNVVDQYKGSDKWLKAPNGKPTKLNKTQWVQARTPSFKNWFGDWETASQNLRPATLFSDARRIAKEFQGKPLVSAEGITATVSRTNLDKMLSASAVHKSESPKEHALAVANLDKLFAQAVTGWVKVDRNQNPNILALRRMFAPMIVESKARMVKLTVKEYTQPEHGNKIYSVEAITVEKMDPVPEMVDADMAEGHRLLTGPTGSFYSILEKIQKFNLFGSSKITDAQGEPLVVYHGTNRSFDSFSSKYNHSDLRSAYFFAENPDETEMYSLHQRDDKTGAQTHPVFLRMQNPMILPEHDDLGDTDKEKELFQKARQAGHDGVVFTSTKKDINGDSLGRVFVVFDPSQIKSATGNRGTYDPKSPKTTEAVMPDPHAEKIKLVQAIIARRGIKPPQPKAPPATKKTPEASTDADPRVKRIRELMNAYC